MSASDDVLYTPEEMAQLCRKSIDALAKLRQRRTGPPWVTLGREVRYPARAFRAWSMSQARASIRQVGEVTTITGSEQ